MSKIIYEEFFKIEDNLYRFNALYEIDGKYIEINENVSEQVYKGAKS